MSVIYNDNATHRANLFAAEQVLQAAYKAANGNQASITAADIAFNRTGRASAIANGCGVELFVDALRSLGTGGV